MNLLAPCPACARHVRTHESACPFCRADLDLSHIRPAQMPTRRLNRKALFAFGATLAASLSTTACGGDTDDSSSKGTGGTTSTGGSGGSGGSTSGGSGGTTGGTGGIVDAGEDGTGNTGGLYGGPPDTGVGGTNTGGAAGTNAGGTAGIAPPYGIPPDG
jgi:hypothetical protein